MKTWTMWLPAFLWLWLWKRTRPNGFSVKLSDGEILKGEWIKPGTLIAFRESPRQKE